MMKSWEGERIVGNAQHKQRHQNQNVYQSLFIQHPNNEAILTDFKH